MGGRSSRLSWKTRFAKLCNRVGHECQLMTKIDQPDVTEKAHTAGDEWDYMPEELSHVQS
jgi:hypothetical protein